MITLTCTKCKTTLEMDDAFAGGVCRCQHCGTIQTVPSHLKNARAATPAAAGAGQKALYSNPAASAIPSSGLDDLANAVASSGLSNSGLSSGLANQRPHTHRRIDSGASPAHSHAHAHKPASNRTALMIGAGAGAAVLIVGVLVFVLAGKKDPPAPAAGTGGGTNTSAPTVGPQTPVAGPAVNKPTFAPKPTGPHFLSLKLDAKKVIYVIDRSSANLEVFDRVKLGLLDSLRSLGPDREFQVFFWPPPAGKDGKSQALEFAYPKDKLAKATPAEIKHVEEKLMEFGAFGTTDAGSPIYEGLKRMPQAIVLVTAKGVMADEELAERVRTAMQKNNKSKAKVYAVDISTDGTGKPTLKKIADEFGGTYTYVSPDEMDLYK